MKCKDISKGCRKCGNDSSIVWESRKMLDKSTGMYYLMRRRRCTKCGANFKTVEVNYWDWFNANGKKLC